MNAINTLWTLGEILGLITYLAIMIPILIGFAFGGVMSGFLSTVL